MGRTNEMIAYETIETSCIGIGDGDNYRSVLLSDRTVTATGHTQTEATDNILADLKKLGRYNDPWLYRFSY